MQPDSHADRQVAQAGRHDGRVRRGLVAGSGSQGGHLPCLPSGMHRRNQAFLAHGREVQTARLIGLGRLFDMLSDASLRLLLAGGGAASWKVRIPLLFKVCVLTGARPGDHFCRTRRRSPVLFCPALPCPLTSIRAGYYYSRSCIDPSGVSFIQHACCATADDLRWAHSARNSYRRGHIRLCLRSLTRLLFDTAINARGSRSAFSVLCMK